MSKRTWADANPFAIACIARLYNITTDGAKLFCKLLDNKNLSEEQFNNLIALLRRRFKAIPYTKIAMFSRREMGGL